MKLCVVTFPMSNKGNIPLANLMDILGAFSTDIFLITGDTGHAFFRTNKDIQTYGVEHKTGTNIFMRIINFITTQFKISYKMLKIISNVDIFLFFIGGEGLLLPMLIARLWKRKVVLAIAGFPARGGRVQGDPLSNLICFLSEMGLILSSRIIVYSDRVIIERGLEKYKDKISVAHEHFLDFDKFVVKKPLRERGNVVGYIGALSEAKGVLDLLQSIPKLLGEENELEFLIAGQGDLFSFVREYIIKNKLTTKVKFLGWIPHDDVPKYLNKQKLFILPSYTEGLPNIILEAMACGTPVLVTPVGAALDVVKEGETGFILEDNSIEAITKNIIRALNHPSLERIADNARALVEKNYTYDAAVEMYRNVLVSLK